MSNSPVTYLKRNEMKIDFSDRVVMVTGASRGIGKEIARQFAASGARVVVHYHKNSQAAEQTVAELDGNSHLIISADLSDAAAVGSLAEKAVKEMGKIDVLVNNAGVYEFHPVATTTFEDWQRSWEKTIFTNLLGPAHLSFHVVRHMMKNGGGKIINITSRGAFRGSRTLRPTAPARPDSTPSVNPWPGRWPLITSSYMPLHPDLWKPIWPRPCSPDLKEMPSVHKAP